MGVFWSVGITSSCPRKELEKLLLSSPKQRDRILQILLLLVVLKAFTYLISNKGCLFMFYLYIYTQAHIRWGDMRIKSWPSD